MRQNIKYTPLKIQIKNKGVIKGYGSSFDKVDQQNDIIARGAFAKTIQAWRHAGKKPKMLWQHQAHKPIGVWEHMHEDAHGLYVEGRLALGIQAADEAYILMKEGVLDGLSIGFRTLKAVQDTHRKARLILDLDLLEISLVTFGANPLARVHGVKFQFE